MAFAWARRARELHDELAAITDVSVLGPTWWLVAGTAAGAERLPPRAHYVASDAEPNGDTFIGHRSPAPDDPIADAVIRAHAARAAMRELDGQLPDQPLAVTIQRSDLGARVVPSQLDIAAFAIGDTVVHARLADRLEDERALVAQLADLVRHGRHAWHADIAIRASSVHAGENVNLNPVTVMATGVAHVRLPDERGSANGAGGVDSAIVPFACVSVGEERITVARHGHRRAWRDHAGPWLGLGRVGDLATVSTCHMAVDGYGHAWLSARIAEHAARLATALSTASSLSRASRITSDDLPHLSLVPDGIPLGVAWREIPSPAPRALELAYALGRVLHRVAGKPDARFSPTFQVPIAPGDAGDPDRIKRRVVHSSISVRFDRGVPEPFDEFEVRAKQILAREAQGRGLCSRLLTAARAIPVPLAFKRRSFTTGRATLFDKIAEVVGGRACLSKIRMDTPVPLSCAVSSPARMATKADPLGGCVLTVIEDGTRAAITACGSGLAGEADDAADLIDAVLALVRA
ncbi:MAG: hypothetical protein ACKV2T_27195 [Kofleriaceae bacterium]